MDDPGQLPDPTTAATPAELVERLRELRLWAGGPSLRRLRQLAGTTVDTGGTVIDALPVSTASRMLRGDRLPRMEFVRAFVTACLRARRRDPAAIAEELERWHEAWLALRREPPPPATAAAPEPAVPRQLPADVVGFTGRAEERALLTETLAGTEVVISAIDGMAGIGKTALAVHAAHRLAEHFPDGQLFIDLHGFTEGVAPVDPGDALDRMLRALGVSAERIPAELDDRGGLWRSVLADRRILIVLDNAGTEEQVAPLLPGAPGCLVLITSRRRLAGLPARHAVSLDMLPVADAIALFAGAVGGERLADEPAELLVEAVQLCGRLPLAIRIAAGRLKSRPAWRVAHLVARLRDHDQRLAELAAGARSVTAALELSYQQLAADHQHLYRVLGLHPGPDIEPYAAAGLAATTPARARRLLDRLLDANLLQEPAPGRFVLHDLVRAHAATVGARDEPERRSAVGRLLDHYRQTASVAMDAAYPYERGRRPQVPPAGMPGPDLPDRAAAIAWLEVELPNLLAAARYAAEDGWPEHLSQLSAILHRHLRTRGGYQDAETLHRQALTVARTTGDRAGELAALAHLAQVHQLQGGHEQAVDHYGWAMELARTTADRTGELVALLGLGDIYVKQGRYEHAVQRFRRALDIARAIGDLAGEQDVLNGLAHIDLLQGRHKQALDHHGQMLETARSTGDRGGELTALHGLGEVHLLQGQHEQALMDFEEALRIARLTSHRISELSALRGLGRVHLMQRRHEQARDHYGLALEIARATGNRGGEIDALLGIGHVNRRQGRHEHAADHYQRAHDMAREISDLNLQFEALHGLGRLRHATGDQDLAVVYLSQALDLATELDQPADQARAHDGLARACRTMNKPEQARQHWRRTLDILTTLGTEDTEDGEVNAARIHAELVSLAQP